VSERAEKLADDFAAANADAIAFVHHCDGDVWARHVAGEEWSVGVVLHHVAEGHDQGVRWLEAMARGEGVTDTAEGIDRTNAAHAARAETATTAETAALLEENGDRLFRALRGLSDDELDRTAPFGPAGGQALPTEALAVVIARHVREHLAHASAAADAVTPRGTAAAPDGRRRRAAGEAADRAVAGAPASARCSIRVKRGADLIGRVGPGCPGCVDSQLVHPAGEGCGRCVARRDGQAPVVAQP
jgi:DinB superfamily